ncbi:unnamed protein product [Pleuronectes platessa]|uniref:Uncharacterized protein n=1 Tax=Pleuronectes platessa TaxID=8262 RepID=A0A9N7UGX5_PLEPL|nr:unnamed protein product [Pleuronectes platessa]
MQPYRAVVEGGRRHRGPSSRWRRMQREGKKPFCHLPGMEASWLLSWALTPSAILQDNLAQTDKQTPPSVVTQRVTRMTSPDHLFYYLLLPGAGHATPTATFVICIPWAPQSTLQRLSREGRRRAQSF